MSSPRVLIDLAKVTDNARRAVERCAELGVEVLGMTKGVAGLPAVARAMLAGGVRTLGDSRLDHVDRMRRAGVEAPIVLTRAVGPGEVGRCVALADASVVTSAASLRTLSEHAVRLGRRHGVTLMVEMGTEREGLAPERVEAACTRVLELPGVELRGLGIYFPNRDDSGYYLDNLRRLAALRTSLETSLGVSIPVLSGGSSNVFTGLTVHGQHAAGVDELRLGTAILVGTALTRGPRYLPGYHGDAFRLESELIEVKERGGVLRGLLALGSLDTDVRHLYPVDASVRVLEASSDHTLVEFHRPSPEPRVGDRIRFHLTYPSLSRLMSSPYTRFQLLDDWSPLHAAGRGLPDPWRNTHDL